MTDAQQKAINKWRKNHKQQYKMSSYFSRAKYLIKHCHNLKKLLGLKAMIHSQEMKILKESKKL